MIDFIVCFRLLQLLLMKWEKTPQYKAGIIDKNGKWLVKEKNMSPEQKKVFSPLVRFAFNLRKLISNLPGGKLASAIIVLKSLREPNQLGESVLDDYPNVDRLIYCSINVLESEFKEIKKEDDGAGDGGSSGDGDVTTTDNIAMFDAPFFYVTRKKDILKKSVRELDGFLESYVIKNENP